MVYLLLKLPFYRNRISLLIYRRLTVYTYVKAFVSQTGFFEFEANNLVYDKVMALI